MSRSTDPRSNDNPNTYFVQDRKSQMEPTDCLGKQAQTKITIATGC